MIRPGWNYRHQTRTANIMLIIGLATTLTNLWVHSLLASIFAWTLIALSLSKASYANGVRDGIRIYNKRPDGKIVDDFTLQGNNHD